MLKAWFDLNLNLGKCNGHFDCRSPNYLLFGKPSSGKRLRWDWSNLINLLRPWQMWNEFRAGKCRFLHLFRSIVYYRLDRFFIRMNLTLNAFCTFVVYHTIHRFNKTKSVPKWSWFLSFSVFMSHSVDSIWICDP